ncbi:MAG: hypothetical protein IJ308_08470 [Clostridia bacterium]|nr:hypothetical protein [Clostridia bacterium]
MKKQFSESKVQVARWKYNRELKGFVAEYEVMRQPFGRFKVGFCVYADGSGGFARIESEKYGGLYWKQEFNTLEEAMQGVDGQFERIQDLAKRMEKRLKELEEHARTVTNKAIMEAVAMQNVDYEYKARG